MLRKKELKQYAGYVCSKKAVLGGFIVVYDTKAGFKIDSDGYRWVVMHEPSSNHIVVTTKAQALQLMRDLAKCIDIKEAAYFADGIFGEVDAYPDNLEE